MANKIRNLTQKQLLFIENIIKGESQRQSYINAGYKNKNEALTDTSAHELINSKSVKQELARRRAALAKKSQWTAEKLIEKYEKIYERSMQIEEILDSEGNGTARFRYDSSGAIKALENIGKILGLYKQTDNNVLVVQNFMTHIQNKLGFKEAK
jgi:phage terminase small subunit